MSFFHPTVFNYTNNNRAVRFPLVALAIIGVLLFQGVPSTASANPPEKESPVVRVGSGSGMMLTNTIAVASRHQNGTARTRTKIFTGGGAVVDGTIYLYATDADKSADIVLVKLDEPVSVYGDSEHFRMDLFHGFSDKLIGKDVRFGAYFSLDTWRQAINRDYFPFWSRKGENHVISDHDSLIWVNGQKFTDLYNPFPEGDGSTSWWGYSGGPLVHFESSQMQFVGVNGTVLDYLNDDPKMHYEWPHRMDGKRGAGFIDITKATGSHPTVLQWMKDFIAEHDPSGRTNEKYGVGPSNFFEDRIAFEAGAPVAAYLRVEAPATNTQFFLERSDGADSTACDIIPAMAANDSRECIFHAVSVEDLSAPAAKKWNVKFVVDNKVIRKIPITIGPALATDDYLYFQGQVLSVRFGGARTGNNEDIIALYSADGDMLASSPLGGQTRGDVQIPIYDVNNKARKLSGVIDVKWLRKNASGDYQPIAETAIELRPAIARVFRSVGETFDSATRDSAFARPLNKIDIDIAGGAPEWVLKVDTPESETVWSRTINDGYERITVPRNENPGTGEYIIKLCSPDGMICHTSQNLKIRNAQFKFDSYGEFSDKIKEVFAKFVYSGAANRDICDSVSIYARKDISHLERVEFLGLHKDTRAFSHPGGFDDRWCYLDTARGYSSGVFPLELLPPQEYVAYMTDGFRDPENPNRSHAASSFTMNADGVSSARTFYEEGPVGSVEGLYRGAPPMEFGWAGRAEHGREIKTIRIRSRDVLEALQITYRDNETIAGGIIAYDWPGAFETGAPGVFLGDEIELNDGETITEVSGFRGDWLGAQHILQLTLKTSENRTFGPYGTMNRATNPVRFEFSAPAGGSIVDFIGASVLIDDDQNPTSERAISALGVIYNSP